MFIITEVSVRIHEKRAHPREYGHYDCEIALTATISPHEASNDAVITALRQIARGHVKHECDSWEAQIEEDARIEQVIANIWQRVRGLPHFRPQDRCKHTKVILRLVYQLPEHAQKEIKRHLREVVRKYPLAGLK